MKLRQSWRLVSLLVVLLVIGFASALTLFQQQQPAVPVAGQMSANCTPATQPTPTNVSLGSSGPMTFSCDSTAPATHPAFTTGGPVTATPTVVGYVAPYNTTRLYIYTANGVNNTGSCGGRTGALKVISGTPVIMPANNWNYCGQYESVGPAGLPSFSITWSV